MPSRTGWLSDAALIRLGGDVGRPITQAVSRALYELHPEVDGIAYWSGIDPSERCWAIYGHVPVDVSITDLSAENPLAPSRRSRGGGFAESPTAACLAVVPAPSCSAPHSCRNSSAVPLPQPVPSARERGRQQQA